MKRLGRIWTVIVYLFLYAPMFILFIGSFNDGKDLSEFEGFTLGNYADLFRNSHLVGLLGNSVLLALCSAVLATLLGTLAALGIDVYKRQSPSSSGGKCATHSSSRSPVPWPWTAESAMGSPRPRE